MIETLENIMAKTSRLSIRDQPYMPQPNLTCVVLTDTLPPPALTTTGFVVILSDDGHTVLANELQRGRYEIPGGHIDPGEDALQAAIREAYEEAGAVVSDLKPIGFLRQIIQGPKPRGYQ